ncbi:hypothetical protein Lfu02_15460 [Longispora fulva]|uniref:5'-3' exonuclease n=1 Tax=Longispora fulva TaxID=619741 RepID=A0A8J7GWX0_9ACTN|nr:5'-3' exonuclease H3TH domain-containing protein [Longispora fulva]MBG6140444.1 DNA polymerase-1 [Longispora fulva]GIG57174.1 hypothetical protein Lfu02_15460 [Longispora fulva]
MSAVPVSLQPALPIPMPATNMPGGPPLLLVDGHHLLYGGTFGFPAAVYSADRTRLLTGTFAFFALLRVAINKEVPGGSPEVIVAFDGENGGASRKEEHPGYKASRPTDEASLLPLTFLPDVYRGLDAHGIARVELDHAEADDVIATLVHATPAPRQVIIMSGDRDYYQLITTDGRVRVLNPRFRDGQRLVDEAAVLERHGVTPAQWADFRALMGDPADEIPGVHGIGAKTAATLLAGGLTLEDLRDSGRLESGRARRVAEQFETALKWRDMIRLTVDMDLPIAPTGMASDPLPTPREVLERLELW